MFLKHAIVIIISLSYSEAIWLSDVISPKGWQFGEGMVFHLEDTKVKNDSFFDRIAIRVDYGDVSVSATQKPEQKAVELDFFVKDKEEGRSKKMGNMMIPFLLGVTKGAALTMFVGALKLLALKSLVVAKVALILSIILLIGKLIKHKEEPQNYMAYGYPDTFQGYADTGSYSTNLNGYAALPEYALSAAGSALNYATVAVSGGNDTVPLQVLPAAKRRDHSRRRPSSTILTIRRYSEPDSGLL